MNISTNRAYDVVQIHHDGALVAEMYGGSFEERVSRARVMASGDELLSTLSDLIAVVETYADAWDPDTDLWDTRRLASEAERKARGMEQS